MAVVVGEAAVRIRPDVDEGEFRSEVEGPVGDALEEAGGSGAAKFTAAFGAALAIGGAFAESLEQAALGDKLAASLGASGQYAEDLGSIAGGLYANAYGESLGEVNDALKSVIQSGAVMEDASNEQLSSVTASVMDLATAMDQDVGGTSRAVGRMIQTGLAANAEEALDILTRGFQQGADRGGDLLDVVGEYGTTFSELGLNGSQSIGLLNQALAAGIPNADFAADALREMGIIGREGGDAAKDAIEDLGLSSKDYFAAMQAGGPQASAALDQVLDALRSTEDPALRSAAATALVGTQYEDLGDAILALDPSEAVGSLGEIEGAAGRMGTTLNDNASTNLTTFWRTAQQAFVTIIGGQVVPIVEGIVSLLATSLGPAISVVSAAVTGYVIPAFQAMATWIENNQTPVAILAGIIAAVFVPGLIALGVQAGIAQVRVVASWIAQQAGAIASVAVQSFQIALAIAGYVAMGAQAAATAVRVVAGWVLMGAQSLLAAARMAAAWVIAMGPVGWIIALVVGLVALIIANWDKVKAFTVNTFRAMVKFVVDAWNSLVGSVSSGISSVINFVSGLPGKILRGLGNLGKLLVGAGGDLMRGLVNGIANAASFVGNVARNIVNGVIGFINSSVIDGINGLLEFSIAGITINPPDIPHIPRLHEGGYFDTGAEEGLALLRRRELVATPEQQTIANDLLGQLLGGRLTPAAVRAGATGTAGANVQIDVHPSPGMDERTLSAHIANDLGWQLSTGATRPVALLGGAS